jgi:hypothetical protein
MTVIVWDGTTLAADKQANVNDLMRHVTKIRRSVTGALMGCTGELCQGLEVMAWYDKGALPEDFPSFQRDKDQYSPVMVITPQRQILLYELTPYPIVFEDESTAIGSGRDFAIVALHFGKNAREAVEVASHFCLSCGGGVDTLSFLKE